MFFRGVQFPYIKYGFMLPTQAEQGAAHHWKKLPCTASLYSNLPTPTPDSHSSSLLAPQFCLFKSII